MAKKRVSYTFDPFKSSGIKVPKGADKEAILESVAEFVVEQTIEHMDGRRSPVAGHGAFPALTKDYKKIKQANGLPGVPDLEFSGDLKSAITYTIKGNQVRIEVTGSEAGKADGHCNHSGESKLPMRRFIPDDGETYKRPILAGIKRLIQDEIE